MAEVSRYEQIRLKYGDEVAKSLDSADGQTNKQISDKNLSIFNFALELLQEEKQESLSNYNPGLKERISNRMNIDHLAPWARAVATKALNYLEEAKNKENKFFKEFFTNNNNETKDTDT